MVYKAYKGLNIMPLYITERVHDYETMYNPAAVFVYFDSVKGDSTSAEALKIKRLDKDSRIAILYRKNMSSHGAWTEEEFKDEGAAYMNKGFDAIREYLIKNRLVIFPIRSFSVIKASTEEWVIDTFNKRYIEIVNTNPEHKDLFDYYAI